MEIKLSEEELDRLCECIALRENKGVYLIEGKLGSGKTALVKQFVKHLGSDASVTSPTYVLCNHYGNGIYHYDIYHKKVAELMALGILEEFEKEGWHFVEWGGDDLARTLDVVMIPYKRLKIEMEGDFRKYIFK
ncbi:tRNA (adenosine(37)-N6)-threonylcarbamoyltransferase complex ATPase subunit type 1 TsaE [Helicobacter valdiviensis]|uniref:tRNA threonylcarbamoyladenosine biosynthesis protein TsaE n=1 Tax=Helicobacter valdiviensis TaxID=1458358 RepID=A0A2W6MU55_9HELI|nr:tRNA (adenosine(37)-N6)-threonylcarbamoyltransferase complex ATPase subunit type 1 TsaE [Helicobacter valdiviensis]PZT47932.1 tRNA (adenosine(37)-N6)-threonylcarbamoyltransferase complex ATPase subunit type 1 TsaE [Helicobacter valdiviensis]